MGVSEVRWTSEGKGKQTKVCAHVAACLYEDSPGVFEEEAPAILSGW